MIVPDTNLLIYAHYALSPEHQAARRWWEGLVASSEPVGIPWVVSMGFVRVITNPSAMDSPATPEQAVDFVRGWFEYPHVTPIEPGSDHLTHLRRILAAVGRGGNAVPDAHIAALAIEHDAEVHTHDVGFRRFPGVRWRDPLRPAP